MPSVLKAPAVESRHITREEVSRLTGLVGQIEKEIRRAIRRRIFLSIVIPAYNEERRIPDTLKKVISYLDDRGYCSEIVIVDDGSTDGTREVSLGFFSDGVTVRVLTNSSNRGKGSAIRKGMLAARGEYVIFMDADMSTPIDELDSILHSFHGGCDVAIGSRKMHGARIAVHQPKYREIMGRMFSFLSRIMTVRSIRDFTCGFKCFKRSCIEKIFKRQTIRGWGYDTEILFIAHKLGFTIREVPVVWSDSADSRVRLWKDVIGSGLDLMRIRLNDILGRYR